MYCTRNSLEVFPFFTAPVFGLLFEVGNTVLDCNLFTTLVCLALLYHSSEHVGLVESDDFLPVD